MSVLFDSKFQDRVQRIQEVGQGHQRDALAEVTGDLYPGTFLKKTMKAVMEEAQQRTLLLH